MVLVAGDITVVAGDDVFRLTAVPRTKLPAAVIPVTVAPPLVPPCTEAGVVLMGVTKRWPADTPMPTPVIWVPDALGRGKYVACVADLVTVMEVFDTDLAEAVGNAVIWVRPGPAFSNCLIIEGDMRLLITTLTCVD